MRRLFIFMICFFFLASLMAQKTSLQTSKISLPLQHRLMNSSGDSITVSIRVQQTVNLNTILNKSRILYKIGADVILVKTSLNDLSIIADLPDVIFINEILIPNEELSSGASDPTLNKINFVQSRFPLINCDSLNVSVKERLFDTTDIDLKERVFLTGLESSAQTSHASLMATIIAGAANSSPIAKGAAPHSKITSANFLNLFPEPDSIFQRNKISIQNHSYGTTVENFYGNEASAFDAQANRLPYLLHIFSAGNSGNFTNTAGPYSGVNSFANLTGNFKQSKNIITVGSVDSSGVLMPLSSRGPAFDGRIKPELVAYGEDGSSGAAALVSGTALLLQDAYQKTFHQLPPSSLVKSVLINSADDIGNPNPDFLTGYGNLNAWNALTTIDANRYNTNSLIQGEIKNFNIQVPAGISKLKLTLVWNDPAALPGATKSLVNDLDLLVKLGAQSWMPWVLNSAPDQNALLTNAARKIDTLNNVEQVTIDQPSAGIYTVQISGTKIISAGQSYSISWQLDSANQFQWTFPSATDPLLSANTHFLRWQTTGSGPAEIEYATNGANWRNIGSVSDISSGYFKWKLPDTITTAVLRMKIISTGALILSDTFTISPNLSLNLGFDCADTFLLYWKALPSVSYRLYELNGAYLKPFLQTIDTAAFINKNQHPAIHYAIAPLINNHEGLRSASLNYRAAGSGCYIKSFFLDAQQPLFAFFRAELGSVFNVQRLVLQKFTPTGFVNIDSVQNPSTLIHILKTDSLHQGENLYRLQLRLLNGTIYYSNIETVYSLTESPVIIYPNPVHQNNVLKFLAMESGRYTIRLFDAGGKLVYKQVLNSNITIFNSGKLAKGLYLARISDKDGKSFTEKLIVY